MFQGDLKQKHKEKELAEDENFGDSTPALIRSWLWNVMEYPWTSKTAQVRGHPKITSPFFLGGKGIIK